jgi:hypothetical protein
MRTHRFHPAIMVILVLALATPPAITAPVPVPGSPAQKDGSTAPAPKAPELRTIEPGPGLLTPLEIVKIEALARAFPGLDIRIPPQSAPRGSFQAPSVTVLHQALPATHEEGSIRLQIQGPAPDRARLPQSGGRP